MKYLLIIFSLYMTILTLLPCQDGKDVSSVQNGSSAIQKASKGIEHFEEDGCPPFCTCACCSVSRHFPIVKEQATIMAAHVMGYTVYCIPAVSDQAIEIYHPPKIV
ncbi:MAG: hypothetical protein EOO88_19335 [Pedobacter sp.]|nr:MAG: hypothetical protein EOO88_19335 [Pedobacter sp.]